jgi:hypothetical protein
MKNPKYYYFAETHRSRPRADSIRIFESEEQLVEYAVKYIEDEYIPDHADTATEKKELIDSNFEWAYRGIYGGIIDETGLEKIKDFPKKIKQNFTKQSLIKLMVKQ